MDAALIIEAGTLLFAVGGFYAATNQRIKNLEDKIKAGDGIGERMARVEAKMDALINNFKAINN